MNTWIFNNGLYEKTEYVKEWYIRIENKLYLIYKSDKGYEVLKDGITLLSTEVSLSNAKRYIRTAIMQRAY